MKFATLKETPLLRTRNQSVFVDTLQELLFHDSVQIRVTLWNKRDPFQFFSWQFGIRMAEGNVTICSFFEANTPNPSKTCFIWQVVQRNCAMKKLFAVLLR